MKHIYKDSFSQSNQESFVLNMLQGCMNGTYIEIGGHDAKSASNTFLLETRFGWSGFAIEIDKRCTKNYNKERKNPCICADATTFDYLGYLQQNSYPMVLDYLQVDIEPANQTLAALMRVPIDKYKFKVITFEHDRYSNRDNERVVEISRLVLKNYGYVLVCSDVKNHGNSYEDWYVHPEFVSEEIYKPWIARDLEYSQIFEGAIII
jgi:hypothetical protein